MKLIKLNNEIKNGYYLLSHEEINLGDVVYSKKFNNVNSAHNLEYSKDEEWIKVIASTKRLSIDSKLPLLSKDTIERMLGIINEDVLCGEIVRAVIDNSSHLLTACDKVKEKIVTLREKYQYESDKKYSLEDLKKILLDFVAFPHPHNEARGSIIDRFSETIDSGFHYNRKIEEWDIEIEMELEPIPESIQEYPMSYTQKLIPKIEQGFIKIKSIK